jgi:predicted esterase
MLAFHGFTLNGSEMRAQLGPLVQALAPYVELMCPDAPHPCTPDSVDRLYALWRSPPRPPPHLSWWDATDDGSVYQGWEETREQVGELVRRHEPVGVLGFSQGAMLAAVVAAMSMSGEVPPLRFAVLIAGRVPRALALKPLFERPIDVPSLHVWGERDPLAQSGAPDLVERFTAVGREVAPWSGPHKVPTPADGAPADSIVDFVRRRS